MTLNLTGVSHQNGHRVHVDKAMKVAEGHQGKTVQGADGAVAALAQIDLGAKRVRRHLLLRRFWKSASGFWRAGGIGIP